MQSIRAAPKRHLISAATRRTSQTASIFATTFAKTGSSFKFPTFRAQPPHPLPSQTQRFFPSTANKMSSIESIITPKVIKDVEDFWFEHLASADELVIPSDVATEKWFFGGPEMDKLCSDRFLSILEALRASGVTSGKQIIDAVKPQQPCEWLSLVLLLDQMPRNCYRGADAGVVFQFFDPLALEITRIAIAEGIADSEPAMRWRFAQRTWFYLPLQHTEDMKIHEEAMREYELVSIDIQMLSVAKAEGESWDEYKKAAWRVVQSNTTAAKGFATVQTEFQRRHTVLIEKFGRYPHRNEALQRPFTEEEKQHLDGGGDSFGGKTEDK